MKKRFVLISISIAVVCVTLLMLFFFGPFSWQITEYESLDLTDHGFDKVPYLSQTAIYEGEAVSFTAGMLPEYSDWLFDDKLKVTKADLFISLGFDRNEDKKDSMDSQTITIPPINKGLTVNGYLQPQYEEYIVYQQRKWRHEETAESHVYRPVLPRLTLEYSGQPNASAGGNND